MLQHEHEIRDRYEIHPQLIQMSARAQYNFAILSIFCHLPHQNTKRGGQKLLK